MAFKKKAFLYSYYVHVLLMNVWKIKETLEKKKKNASTPVGDVAVAEEKPDGKIKHYATICRDKIWYDCFCQSIAMVLDFCYWRKYGEKFLSWRER